METENAVAVAEKPAHSRFDNPLDFTVVVAVDDRTAEQWRGTWPTWRHFHPDILARPLLVIADAWAAGDSSAGTGQTDYWMRRLGWLDHPDWSLALWDWPDGRQDLDAHRESPRLGDVTQRERMLTSYCRVPGAVVETEYWVKIDTDAVATAATSWVNPEWFADNPAIVASPWSYTKPAAYLTRLEEWAAKIDSFSALSLSAPFRPRLDLGTIDPAARRHRHPRIASWICFVDTLWSQRVAEYAPDRLPVPSQDTYHWYCAARRGDLIRRVKFKKCGWTNVSGDRSRHRLVAKLMGGVVDGDC